ncbi:MAG: hypothetical protein L6Q37_15475, partial [Bdellovibrionaceae bacterium]|nr:hypothetical protein [Pseudobdellovibrionaceae bacterium]
MKKINLSSIFFRSIFVLVFFICQNIIAQMLPTSSLKSLGKESDSGIKGPSYAELVRYFSTLPQKYPEQVQLFNYGMTPKKRPLLALRIAYPQRFLVTRSSVGPAILITGATHGNEYLNIEDRLPEWFAAQAPKNHTLDSYFKTGGVIYIIPIFNPDGYDTRRRENSRGIDLNRDYTVKQANYVGFKEIETQ